MDIVKNYPTMVKAELKGYDEGVCKFFEVGRNQPVSDIKKNSFIYIICEF